ncbi:MAG: MerR family transcriptional regulator [bacterium]|nr:MerR family transcriptional regulator [bacterium]
MSMQNKEDVVDKSQFTIGEVAEQLGVSASLIRFYEKEFPQLKPRKTLGGTRKFNADDILLLKKIYQLIKVEGYTIPGAKDRLREKPNTPNSIDEIKLKLTDIKNFLTELKNQLS